MAKEKVEQVHIQEEVVVAEQAPQVLEEATVKVIAKETRTIFWGQQFDLVAGKEVEIPADMKAEWEELGLCK
jgi:hypothetical protein